MAGLYVIPPSPVDAPFASYLWSDWYEKVRRAINQSLTATIAVTQGGTGITSYAIGDILYASGTTTLAKRAIGSAGQVLTVSGGLPVWATSTAGAAEPAQHALLGGL